ncbi:MAG: tetratricopeptide repeat protein [Deltaproteobacteria bacterium]|nr:MAG: tetratricopeptide repeat protein [Deltaproteobacteria bacterium]
MLPLRPTRGNLPGREPSDYRRFVGFERGVSVPRQWMGAMLALALFVPTALRAATQSLQISIPAGALTGRSDGPPITVTVVDSNGVIDTTVSDKVGIEIGANPTGASLQGTVVLNANQGVAVFRDVTLDRGGDGFTLVAWSPRLADVTSAPFAFMPAPRPQEALGYGCASAGSGELAVLGLVALITLRRRRLGWMSLVLALGVSVAGTANAAGPGKTPAQAPAQQAIDVARTLNRKGIEALSQGRYEEAIAMFEEAQKSVSSPSLLYNLAESHRRAGHIAQALELYHAYVAAVPDGSKRADLSDFERLERRQLAATEPVKAAAPRPEAFAAYDPPSFDEKPAAPRRWLHAPGVFAGVAWLPRDRRAGYETLVEVEAGDGFRFSAGALISPRPGGRVALERRLYREDDFSVGFALRGMVASFPGRALTGGGGGFSLRMQATENIEVSSGLFLEYYSTTGEGFLTPIVTAGIGLHL